MNRRNFLSATAAAALVTLGPRAGAAQSALPSEIRIGYQKSGPLLITKQDRLLEKKFGDRAVAVKWLEFPFGPPLLEALNTGNIDYGATGDTPPIFAQAARAKLLYVAANPGRGDTQAIVVPPDSPLQNIRDLKGKKVGIAKASSAHDLAVAAVESAGLAFTDIVPVYLAPADAAVAFARGAIDAWSIWDPFLAIAEITRNARRLPIDPATASQNSFYLANRDFVGKYPHVVAIINAAVADASSWAKDHREEAAQIFSDATGVDLAAQRRTVLRTDFMFSPMTPPIITQQQAVADRFRRLGLIPSPVRVSDIVWTWTPSA
ncbi:MAG TPA: aliphatic sulfonate ABC transporter substrate-binding protein [Acetobacteraceae bacterium]|nr:aliphatic sulfonate ABC transporter substrate-binding protein [Acetobacteraceae bacterium]